MRSGSRRSRYLAAFCRRAAITSSSDARRCVSTAACRLSSRETVPHSTTVLRSCSPLLRSLLSREASASLRGSAAKYVEVCARVKAAFEALFTGRHCDVLVNANDISGGTRPYPRLGAFEVSVIVGGSSRRADIFSKILSDDLLFRLRDMLLTRTTKGCPNAGGVSK